MVQTTRKLSAALEENGFKRCNVDHYLFFQTKSGERLVVLIYVDDLIVTSTNPIAVANLKWIFHQKFSLKDIGALKYFLSIKKATSHKELFFNQ